MFGIPCLKSQVIFSYAKARFQRLTYSQESWSETLSTVHPRVSAGPGEQFTFLLGHYYITLLISCLLWIVPCRMTSVKDYGLNSARLPKTLLTWHGDFIIALHLSPRQLLSREFVAADGWLDTASMKYYQIKGELVFSNWLFHTRPSWESWLPTQAFKET